MFCAGSGKSDVSIMNRNGNVSESYMKTSAIQSAAIAKLKWGVKGELEEFLHDENLDHACSARGGVRWSRAVPTN